eukprot:13182542-Alexandrium_andersonii.AAC.1
MCIRDSTLSNRAALARATKGNKRCMMRSARGSNTLLARRASSQHAHCNCNCDGGVKALPVQKLPSA